MAPRVSGRRSRCRPSFRTIGSRHAKRRAEDLAEDVSGVKHVQNNLRVVGATDWTDTGQGGTTGSAARPSTAGGPDPTRPVNIR